MSSVAERIGSISGSRIREWIIGFGRFWYRFVIGDDWRIAAAVVLGLLVTWGLHLAGVPAWWLLPVVVGAITYVTLVGRRS